MRKIKLLYRFSQWRRLIGLVLLVSGSLSLTGCHGDSPSTSLGNRFIYNNDGTEILFNNWLGNRSLTIEDIHSYVDILADNTQVTTLMICSGSDFVYYRSKYTRPLGDDKGGGNCPVKTMTCILPTHWLTAHLVITIFGDCTRNIGWARSAKRGGIKKMPL